MGRLVLIDGVSCAPEQAKVSVYDRGFLYGDSVFETIRTYGGAPFALAEHVQRLQRSANIVGIRLEVSTAELAAEVERAVDEAGFAESYVRMMISRGVGPLGLDSAQATKPLRVILVEPLTLPPEAFYGEGVAVVCVQTVRAADAAHSAKLGNYLASVLALRDASAAGAAEALVVNRDGHVVEGTTSNVFIVRYAAEGDGPAALVTPPLDMGVLPGITRALVLEVARGCELEVVEAELLPQDVAAADEVFVTSSIRELLPVVRVDDQRIGSGQPGRVTRELHRAFREHLGAGDQPMPWQRTGGR